MPARCTPGVRGTWARYIEPNLPAPMRPTRMGLPCGGALLELGVKAHVCRLLISSNGTLDVCSALAGRPSFQGSSTG